MVLTRGGLYVADVVPHGMASSFARSNDWATQSMPQISSRSSASSFGRGKAYPQSPTRESRHASRQRGFSAAQLTPSDRSKGIPRAEKKARPFTEGARVAPARAKKEPAKNDGMERQRRLRGIIYPKSGEGKDGYVKDPQFDTRSRLNEYRRLSNLPHHTFDVDGDGVISQEDFLLANKFDDNGDGVLQDDERHELRKKMVENTIDEYIELPNRPDKRETMDLIQAFTTDVDKTVDDVAFTQHYQKLVNSTAISRTYDSKKIYGTLQPYPNIAKPKDSLHRTKPNPKVAVWDRLHTPNYDLDTHRPVDHSWSGHFTRSGLIDQRFRDTRNQAENLLSSPRNSHPTTNKANIHKRTSMSNEARPVGHKHLGLPHATNFGMRFALHLIRCLAGWVSRRSCTRGVL
jgi:hypothetical protein